MQHKHILFVSWVGDSDLLAWAATALDWEDEKKTIPGNKQIEVIDALKGNAFSSFRRTTREDGIVRLQRAKAWTSSIICGLRAAINDVRPSDVTALLLSNLDHHVVASFAKWLRSSYGIGALTAPHQFNSSEGPMSYKESYDWVEQQTNTARKCAQIIWFNLTAGSPAMTTSLVLYGKLRCPTTSRFFMMQNGALVDCPIPLDLIEIWNRRDKELRKGVVEYSKMVGNSSILQKVKESAERVAQSPLSVLILGPNGSGKELLARAIHKMSGRKTDAFVPINCALFSADLLGSELFGHIKGAFTGAVADRKGKALAAKDGTLFLDEIGDCPLEVQAQLLRFLQPNEEDRLVREITPLGADTPLPEKPSIRIIAATNKPLQKLVRENKFREDLYYRLAAWTIIIPSLEERKSDIPGLVKHFLELCYRSIPDGIPLPRIDDQALNELSKSKWPGNVRQLRSVIERSVVLAGTSGKITKETVVTALQQDGIASFQSDETDTDGKTLDELLTNVQRYWIEEALSKTGGNKRKAAAVLGLSAQTLSNRIASYSGRTTHLSTQHHPLELASKG